MSGGGPTLGAITITTLAQHHRARRPLVQQR
jgi:hypothetical protein